MSHRARSRALPTVIACVAIAALALPALAESSVHWGARVGPATAQPSEASRPPRGSMGGRSPSGTNATVACKRLRSNNLRCTMTIKGGAAISGTVGMRITRGSLLVALGHGRLTRGKATLTMRVLHRMTPGRYTVTMVVTIKATIVLRLP